MNVQRELLVAVALAFAGCDSQDLDAGEAARLSEPHLSSFVRFDAWARRALGSDPGFRTNEAREETIFAPIRMDNAVVGAWVEHAANSEAWQLNDVALPAGELDWVPLRDERLGKIRVATSRMSRPGAEQDRTSSCVLIERTASVSPNHLVRVVAAYALPGTEGS